MTLLLTDSGVLGQWATETASGNAASGASVNLADYDYVKFNLTGSSWHGIALASNMHWTGIISPSSVEITIPTTGSGTFSASGLMGVSHTARSGPDDNGYYNWTAISLPPSYNIANRASPSATCSGTAVYTYNWTGENGSVLEIGMPNGYYPTYEYFSKGVLYESGRMHFVSAGVTGWVITTSYSETSTARSLPSTYEHPGVWSAFGDSASSYTAYRTHATFLPFSSEAT